MNNEELSKKLEEQGKLLEQVYVSVEKTRKYFQWTLIATLIAFVLPLILAIIVLPMMISSYTDLVSGMGLGI
jgi:hypothetical protein